MQNKPFTIFLADDDADDRLFFKEALEELKKDLNFLSFDNGVTLMDNLLKAEKKLPDIIFLDLNMPLMNGYECLSDIRNEPILSKLPVVIYSTTIDPVKVDLLRKKGANLYLQKPISFEQLKSSLKKCITFIQDGKSVSDSTEFVITSY